MKKVISSKAKQIFAKSTQTQGFFPAIQKLVF